MTRLLLVPLLLLSGCDGWGFSDDAYSMRLGVVGALVAGEDAALFLQNASSRTYTFDPCTVRLEKRDREGWVEIREGLARTCTSELRSLAPDETVRLRRALPPDLSPRTDYRFGAYVQRRGGPQELVFSPVNWIDEG